MYHYIKKILKFVGSFLAAIGAIIFIIAIVGFMLYQWFGPENIKETLIGIAIIAGIFLCLKIGVTYDYLRNAGIISSKIHNIICKIGWLGVGVYFGIPILACVYLFFRWLIDLI